MKLGIVDSVLYTIAQLLKFSVLHAVAVSIVVANKNVFNFIHFGQVMSSNIV